MDYRNRSCRCGACLPGLRLGLRGNRRGPRAVRGGSRRGATVPSIFSVGTPELLRAGRRMRVVRVVLIPVETWTRSIGRRYGSRAALREPRAVVLDPPMATRRPKILLSGAGE